MIETQRLLLLPLTHAQLLKYIRCDPSLEAELKLKASDRSISPELQEALTQTLLPAAADTSRNYLFNTLWTGIDKQENCMVGDVCITGEPNAEGEIEIGYGTYEAFQGKGYMTEMVSGIAEWARAQPAVRSIVAETDKSNTASQRVLEKNHFICIGETDTQLRWKLVLRRG